MAKKDNDSTAYVYAQALHAVAHEAGVVVQIEQQLQAIAEVVKTGPASLGKFFASPAIGFEAKASIYRKTFGGRIHPILLNFILTATKNKRSLAMMEKCLFYFRELCNQTDGIAELEVRSARKLESAELEKLKEAMKRKLGRKIQVVEKLDASLLGGFVVLHQNQQWDASVTTRLERLKQELKKTKFPATVLKD
jgi:F-type H+-transporting ATPase subunit delta